MPNAIVYAFEIDSLVANLGIQIARENNVDDKTIFKGECNTRHLESLDFSPSQKGLIVCDCEGCEIELLNPIRLPHLAHCDLLPERHAFCSTGPTAFEIFHSRFKSTHIVHPINIQGRDPNHFSELNSLNKFEIKAALSQRRVNSVGWVFLEAIAS